MKNFLNWNDFQKIVQENCVSQFQQRIKDDLYFAQYKTVFKNTKLGDGMMATYALRSGVNFFYSKFRITEAVRVENMHAEDCFALYFSLGGKIKVIDEHTEKGTLSKGSFGFYKTCQGISCLDIIPTDEPYEVIGLHFSLAAFKEILGNRLKSLPTFITDTFQSEGNYYRIESMSEDMYIKLKSYQFDVNEDLSHQLYIESKLYELTSYAIGHFTQSVPDEGLTPDEELLMNRAVEQFKKNLVHPPSFEQLATQLKISRTRLNRLFKMKYGLSPHLFLKELRLLEAKRLLEKGLEDVNGAAFRVGYDSVSSFSRAFLKKFGSRPGNFIQKR